MHASAPIKKLIKQDPTGMDLATFLTTKDRLLIQSQGYLDEGSSQKNLKIGQQEMCLEVEVKNMSFEEKVLSLVLVKEAEIQIKTAA